MLAIISARGGSTGFPRKNIAPLAGKPLITYSIKAARHAARVSRVIVSTDDEEIADISRDAGADVPFIRPADLATDTIPAGAAAIHAADTLSKSDGVQHDSFVMVQPTSPLFLPEELDQAISMADDNNVSAVISLTADTSPMEAVFLRDEDSRVSLALKKRFGIDAKIGTRQSYGERYRMVGAFTVVRRDLLAQDYNYFYSHPDVRSVVLPPERAVDIDGPVDLKLAEILLQDHLEAQGETKGT
jgi:CMP-N,N'-diacetyllegionaminic acid synthase